MVLREFTLSQPLSYERKLIVPYITRKLTFAFTLLANQEGHIKIYDRRIKGDSLSYAATFSASNPSQELYIKMRHIN